VADPEVLSRGAELRRHKGGGPDGVWGAGPTVKPFAKSAKAGKSKLTIYFAGNW